MNLKRFKDYVVLVTGASRGIGEAIARRFAEEKANLILNANEEKVYKVAEDIHNSLGVEVFALCGDVSVKKDVEQLVSQGVKKFGKIDVSVHNAGIITHARIEDLTEEEWDRVMQVNAKGVFLCCQAAASQMLKQEYGKIINVASGAARQGFKYIPHYSASKFAVVGITQSLALELATKNITVNAFCPGIIDTDMWKKNDREFGKLLGNYAPRELMREWVQKMIPMKRAGSPKDVVGLVTFLASHDADYITGQTINVDGGIFMS